MNEHRLNVWLNKALPEVEYFLDDDGHVQAERDGHPRLWRPHAIDIEGVQHVMAADGYRLHIAANPPKRFVRRGHYDAWCARVTADLPLLHETPEASGLLTVERGLLRRLHAYREASVNIMAPVAVVLSEGGIELWTSNRHKPEVCLWPDASRVDTGGPVRFVQARYLADALYAFYERNVTVQFVTHSLILTDYTYTACLMGVVLSKVTFEVAESEAD